MLNRPASTLASRRGKAIALLASCPWRSGSRSGTVARDRRSRHRRRSWTRQASTPPWRSSSPLPARRWCDHRASPAAWGRLGMAFDVHGFTDLAMRCFVEAERLDPSDAAWPYFQGLIQTPSTRAAAAKLRRSAELCGTVPDAPRLRLGLLLLAAGNLTRAEEHFQEVLRHDPDNARAHFGLARAAFSNGDWPSAREQVAHCLVDPTTRIAARTLLAQVHERLGNSAAAEAYRQAAEARDDQPWPDPFVLEANRLQTGRKTLLVRAASFSNRAMSPSRSPSAGRRSKSTRRR